MASIILVFGVMLLISSVLLWGIARDLKRLGFSEEAQQVLLISMRFTSLGFLFVFIAYPKLVTLSYSFNEELFY